MDYLNTRFKRAYIEHLYSILTTCKCLIFQVWTIVLLVLYRIHIMYEIRLPVERSGFLKFWTLTISDLWSSLITIFMSAVMACPAGLQLKGDEEQEHVGGLPFIRLMSRHSSFYSCNETIGGNSSCIIVKKKIQVKIWWNTRLGLFVIEDIAYSHSVNAFVGIPKLKKTNVVVYKQQSLIYVADSKAYGQKYPYLLNRVCIRLVKNQKLAFSLLFQVNVLNVSKGQCKIK